MINIIRKFLANHKQREATPNQTDEKPMEKENANISESLLPRFQGQAGDFHLSEVLCNQILIRGDIPICEEFEKVINLIELNKGEVLIKQEGADDSIYFILSGSFSILVNCREVAKRSSGHHVGEMSLIDHTARRSASVIALEPCVVASVNAVDFATIANKYPQVWRRIAIELSNRLKQRNLFLEPPRNKPVVFIGSSSEGLEIAREIQSSFSHDDFVVNVWNRGVFGPSSTTIESLMNAVKGSDFGVIVFNSDDIVIFREEETTAPRDNVIFELGLFIGHIGRERTFFVVPKGKDIKIPSDLLGVTPLEYTDGNPETLNSRMGPVTTELRRIIKKMGPR